MTPAAEPMLIVACVPTKTRTTTPVPALQLYQDDPYPALRDRIGADPARRARLRILSAEHGLVTADTPLTTYDRALDPPRAVELRPQVAALLRAEWRLEGTPRQLAVVAEPLYLVLLADLLPLGLPLRWITDVFTSWPALAAVLDQWGWR